MVKKYIFVKHVNKFEYFPTKQVKNVPSCFGSLVWSFQRNRGEGYMYDSKEIVFGYFADNLLKVE